MACDQKSFDRPGRCPDCGATLVEQVSLRRAVAPSHKAAILVFEGVQIIDFTEHRFRAHRPFLTLI